MWMLVVLLSQLILPINAFTRIDLDTSHIISYDKPLVVVDDFIKTTIHYDFGKTMLNSFDDVNTTMYTLLDNYDVAFDSQLHTTHSIMQQYGRHFKLWSAVEILHTITCGGKTLADILNGYKCNGDILPCGDWISSHEMIRLFFTYKHFYTIFNSDNDPLFHTYFPYLSSTDRDKLRDVICLPTDGLLYAPLITDFDEPKIRNRRWDSSYTCGWPIVSALSKIVGGECSTNIDVNALKQNLKTIQDFSQNNIGLIDDVSKQLKIVNQRVSKQYTVMEDLIKNINDNQAKRLLGFANAIKSLKKGVEKNRHAILYNGLALRLYQSIVDFRLSYIETLDAFQNNHRYGTVKQLPLDENLQSQLNSIGYQIPMHSKRVPYSYSEIRYLTVYGSGFYDLEIDVYIPVVSTTFDPYETIYHAAYLSPLPISHGNNTFLNRHSGPAICDQNKCLRSPVNGFCYHDGQHFFCLRQYIDSLQPIGLDFDISNGTQTQPMFLPPNTVYFPSGDIRYFLTTQKPNSFDVDFVNVTSLPGTLLYLDCKTIFEYVDSHGHTVTYDMTRQLHCTKLIQATNVYITTNTTVTTGYVPLSGEKFDAYAELQQQRLDKLLNTTLIPFSVKNVDDMKLNQQFESLNKQYLNQKQQQKLLNEQILQQISDMKAADNSTPIWFYILFAAAIVFIIKIFLIK